MPVLRILNLCAAQASRPLDIFLVGALFDPKRERGRKGRRRTVDGPIWLR